MTNLLFSLLVSLLGALLVLPTTAVPVAQGYHLAPRTSNTTNRLVFAHFMVCKLWTVSCICL